MEAQPNPSKRADPRPRTNNPGLPGHLLHRRNDRAYLLANPNDNIFGLAMHLDSGWTKVNGGKDGDKERVHSGKVEADGTVSFQGQVLIYLEKADYDRREAAKHALTEQRTAMKKAPGGPDGIVDVDGTPAQDQ